MYSARCRELENYQRLKVGVVFKHVVSSSFRDLFKVRWDGQATAGS